MTPPIVVPAPTFRDDVGALDLDTTHRYADALAATWTPVVLVSGPMGRGEDATVAERGTVLDVWLHHVPGDRLVAACWSDDDVAHAQIAGVRPLVMLQADTTSELVDQVNAAPAGSWVYANPRYSRALVTPELVATSGTSGVKLSKVTADELTAMRTRNPQVTIVHGSSRDIQGSLNAGADLVTVPPLAALPRPWPAPDIRTVQTAVDDIQRQLDQINDHQARVDWITTHSHA